MEQEIIDRLKALKPGLQKLFGITELAIFGSYARGEDKSTSDIDIVILKMERKNGLVIARAKRYLSEQLGKEVDIGLYDSLRPFVRRRVERELIHV
ncbi:nucleotidyltransferase family protein [Thermatribacter velox]|uniref:Nucleotidyltransferase family protein n=1 Tax=Thermatribacter velox TaxID=3039681 RepID=A0ABZ2YCH9_9BACT